MNLMSIKRSKKSILIEKVEFNQKVKFNPLFELFQIKKHFQSLLNDFEFFD